MIDVSKVKKGDKLYTFNWLSIYEPDDGYYDIQFPIGIKSFYVKEIVIGCLCNHIISRCGNRIPDSRIYLNKEKALKGLKGTLLTYWKEYNGEQMLKDLLKVKEIVNRLED